MKILLMDNGYASDILSKVLFREGHDVYVTNDHYGASRYATLLGFREDYSNVFDEYWDLVIGACSLPSRDGIVDAFRAKGIPALGGRDGLRLEEEKDLGRTVFEEAGLPAPRWKRFEDYEDAVKAIFCGDFDKVVLKFFEPSDLYRTVVCNSAEDAIFELERRKENPVIVEEFIDGIEVGFTAYWDGHRFVPSVTNFEHKHLCAGNMGVLTGEMGTALFYDPTPLMESMWDDVKSSPTAKEYLKEYRGWIDINSILGRDGKLYPLEFTCRFGIPTISIEATLFDDNTKYGEFLLSVAKGDLNPTLLSYRPDFAVGIVLVVSGFPYHRTYPDICRIGSPIRGLETLRGLHSFGDIGFIDGVHVTESPWVMVVTGTGKNMNSARFNACKEAEKVRYQDIVYRQDIGASFDKNNSFLYRSGVISQFRYMMQRYLS